MEQTGKPTKTWKAKCALVCFVLLLVLGLAFWRSGFARGPVVDGRPLSAWFNDFMVEPALSRGKPLQHTEVFRKAGPAAVPFLIRELANKSALGEKYVRLKSSSPGWAFKVLPTVRLGNWTRRECAALILGEIGPPASNAVPALIEALTEAVIYETDKSKGASNGQTFSPFARIHAIQALGKIAPDSPAVVSAIIDALKQKYVFVPSFAATALPSKPSSVADSAAAALSGLGPEFKDQIPTMIANLKHEDQRQYRGGISSVVTTGAYSKQATPLLLIALTNASAEFRSAAAYDLGTLGNKYKETIQVAMPKLVEALGDDEASVRINAAETLLSIDAKQSGQIMPVALNLLTDTNYVVRLRAIDLLRQFGTHAKKAVPVLGNALKDDSRTVQMWANETLKQIDPDALAKTVHQ